MPTYEYICKACGHTFEKFQSMNDKPEQECPQCGKAANRIISGGAGIIMKSRDFYASNERKNNLASGRTCCGRDTRCDTPPCSDGGTCKR